MGIFSCCFGSRKPVDSEADKRHARIVEIYRQAEAETAEHTQAPPPAYKDIASDAITGTALPISEKQSQAATQPQSQWETRPSMNEPASRPSSPQTSIYSVPSTRFTDITSAHTGATIRTVPTYQGDSPRSSMVFESAPPSYYDSRSIRTRSRSPCANRQLEGGQHPVMANEWLDRLLRTAEISRNT